MTAISIVKDMSAHAGRNKTPAIRHIPPTNSEIDVILPPGAVVRMLGDVDTRFVHNLTQSESGHLGWTTCCHENRLYLSTSSEALRG
jgi:hypothetical protein